MRRFAADKYITISSADGREKCEAIKTNNRTAYTNSNCELHLTLHRHPHRSDMFRCICLFKKIGEGPKDTRKKNSPLLAII